MVSNTRLLTRLHPASGKPPRKPRFTDLVKLYGRLEREMDIVRFGGNYVGAVLDRAPEPGRTSPGQLAEAALLKELAFCINDRVKFQAIRAFGAFAPPDRLPWLVERAAEREKGARNPNVVLVNCLDALGRMAARVPDPAGRGRKLLLSVVPLPVEVLEREGRNNGACGKAREALETIIEATGSVKALEAYLVNLETRPGASDWMERINARYVERTRKWLTEKLGQDLGDDPAAWRSWLAKRRARLRFDPRKKVFVLR